MLKSKNVIVIMAVMFIIIILEGTVSMAAYTQGDMLDERFANISNMLDRDTLLQSDIKGNLGATNVTLTVSPQKIPTLKVGGTAYITCTVKVNSKKTLYANSTEGDKKAAGVMAADGYVNWDGVYAYVTPKRNTIRIKIYGYAAGSCQIKISCDGAVSYCDVTVVDTTPTLPTIRLSTIGTVEEGERFTVTATTVPSNGKYIYSWSCTDLKNVELIGKTGNCAEFVALQAIDKTTITVKENNSGIIARQTMRVVKKSSTDPTNPPTDPTKTPTSIILTPNSIQTTTGLTGTVRATIQPEGAKGQITWTCNNSSDPDLLNLWQSDDVTLNYIAKKIGSANIIATITGTNISAICPINVTDSTNPSFPTVVTGMTLDKSTINIAEGQTEKITATILPDAAANKAVIWASSNPKIVTVDQNGNITAVKTGTALVKATSAENAKISKWCTVTVMGITVAPTNVTLVKGNTQQLTATPLLPETITDKTVKWTSGAPLIVEVDQTGKVTAKRVGTAVITAIANSDSNVKGSCTITVTEVPTAVTVTPAETYIIIDPETNTYPTLNLKATVTPTNASQEVTWINGNAKLGVAIIDETGKVTPKASGNVSMFATTKYNENNNDTNKRKLGSCLLHVGTEVESISIKSNTTLSIGAIETLKAEITPTGATNKGVKWTSSDESIVIVDAKGNIKAIGKGTAKITATSYIGEKTATCTVIVAEPISGLTLDKTELSLLVGETQTLNATIFPKEANQKTIWLTSNKDIATVDNTGKVTAISAGKVKIVAYSEADKTKRAECLVTVKLAESPIESDEYVVTEENIMKILPQTNKEDFMNKIKTNNRPTKIKNKDSEVEISVTETIKTGMKLEIDDNIYTLVVTGDINGDGKCSLIDLSILKLYTVSAKKLVDEYLLASDMNGNGKTDLPDLSIMKLYTVGLRELE